jgi:hypothetical protein
MLNTDGFEDYLKEVKAFAVKVGKGDQLQSKLNYLDTYADHEGEGLTRCLLGKDHWAPQSFSFIMQRLDKNGEYQYWFDGGLIFHGSHDNGGDGGAPTYSVNLNPEDGWSIHT